MSLSDEIKKKKRSKIISRIIYFLLFTSISYWAYYYFSEVKKPVEVIKKTYTVSTSNLDIYVNADGKVISWKNINLSFPISWKIKNIYKKEWEKISKNERIAILDDSSYLFDINQADINIKNNYAILAEKKEISDNAKNLYKKDLDLAQANLDNAKQKAISDINKSQNDYNILQTKIDNISNNLSIESDNLLLIEKDEDAKIENLSNLVSFKSNLLFLDIDKYLQEIDEFLWITDMNKYKNDSFENYLSAKNTSIKIQAETLFIDLNNNYSNTSFNLLDSYVLKIKELLWLTISVLENSVSSSSFTENEIYSRKQTFQDYLNSFESTNHEYLIAKQNLDYEKVNKKLLLEKQNNKIKSMQWDLEIAKKDLEIAKNNLADTKILSKKSVDIATKELQKAEAVYQDKISWLSEKELKTYYIAIEEAKNNKQKALNSLKDTILTSPNTWTILDINYKIWEFFWINSTPFATIVSSDWQYIESYIEEKDITNIVKWENVVITFDAIDNFSLTGIVTYVSDKWEEDENKVITYKTLISFDSTSTLIKDSMSANLDFLINSIKNDIIIPVEFVYYENWESRVLLDSWVSVKVKEWITDWEKVQILEWLKIGDKIIMK